MNLFGISVFAGVIKDLKIRSSSWITHGGPLGQGVLNPATGVLIRRREETHREKKAVSNTDAEEKAMRGWSQKQEDASRSQGTSVAPEVRREVWADYPLEQGSPNSRPCTSTSCQISNTIRLEVKYTKYVKGSNHPETIPPTPRPPSVEKLSSMKSVPDA